MGVERRPHMRVALAFFVCLFWPMRFSPQAFSKHVITLGRGTSPIPDCVEQLRYWRCLADRCGYCTVMSLSLGLFFATAGVLFELMRCWSQKLTLFWGGRYAQYLTRALKHARMTVREFKSTIVRVFECPSVSVSAWPNV